MITFWVLAVALVVSAVMTVRASKPVYSVIWLLVHFVSLAIMYLTLTAEFLAVTQLLVYTGAILMLFVFVIALLSSGVGLVDIGPDRMRGAFVPSVGLAIIALVGVLAGVSRTPLPVPSTAHATSLAGDAGAADVFGSITDFGKALFTTNLLPFEVTALILMVAIIGVVLLAGDHEPLHPSSARKLASVRRKEREAILREGR